MCAFCELVCRNALHGLKKALFCQVKWAFWFCKLFSCGGVLLFLFFEGFACLFISCFGVVLFAYFGFLLPTVHAF